MYEVCRVQKLGIEELGESSRFPLPIHHNLADEKPIAKWEFVSRRRLRRFVFRQVVSDGGDDEKSTGRDVELCGDKADRM